MKRAFGSKLGFTLIELLVVVLIIGILAAVALPQYRVAVAKSKLMPYLPVIRAIADAEKAWKMSNGDMMTGNVENLDISLPTGFSSNVSLEDGEWEIGTYRKDPITIYVRQKSASLEAALIENGKEVAALDYFLGGTDETDPIRCEAPKENQLGKNVCKSICGPLKLRGKNYCGCYIQGTIPDGTEATNTVCS